MPHQQPVPVGIIGLGLVGGSLALRLLSSGVEVRAYDTDPATRHAAAEAGIRVYAELDELLADLPPGAVLFLATPLPQVLELMPRIAQQTDDTITVSDVVSVKGAVLQAATTAGLAHRYVGAHPMAGTTSSGFAAAAEDLLAGATWVVTLEPGTALERWLAVCDLALLAGGRVVAADAEWHDHATAWISHLPHVLAEILSSNVEPRSLAGALAAGSYRDATRVAGTRPELVEAMLVGNSGMLTEVLEGFLDQLEQATYAVRDRDVRGLVDWGHRHRTEWQERKDGVAATERTTVSTGDHGLRDWLIDLGARGGFVVSHENGTLTALT